MDIGMILMLYTIYGLIFGGFSAFVAREKNRDGLSWAFLGFAFGVIALIAVVGVPSRGAQQTV